MIWLQRKGETSGAEQGGLFFDDHAHRHFDEERFHLAAFDESFHEFSGIHTQDLGHLFNFRWRGVDKAFPAAAVAGFLAFKFRKALTESFLGSSYFRMCNEQRQCVILQPQR